MKKALSFAALLIAMLFGFSIHAQAQTRISPGPMNAPGGQIAWPSSCTAGLPYIPANNSCVGPAQSVVVLNPALCGTANAPSWCSGTDPCQYIAAAVGTLPSTGGIVDGSSFSGTLACTVNPFSTAGSNGLLLLGYANFKTTAEWEIPSSFAWRIVGAGRKSEGNALNTTIQAAASFPANTPVVRLGSGTTSYGQSISNLTVDCNGVTGGIGIYSTDIQEESGVDHVTILNCPNRGLWMNGSTTDGSGPFWAENYYVRDLYVLPLSFATTSTINCEFDGNFTPFHELEGSTCGGSSPTTQVSGVGFLFDKIYGGVAENLNAEDNQVGYLLGKTNSVFGLTLNGIQGSSNTQAVIRMKSADTSIVLTGIINGGSFSPETIDDPGHLAAPITDFSVGLYAVGSENLNNGVVPVVSTSPVVPALLPSLTLNNGINSTNTLFINSGNTAASGAGVTFEDRGAQEWSVAIDPNEHFEVFNNQTNFQMMGATPGSNGGVSLRAQGTGAVEFNEIPNSGTGGVQFWSGGTTPTQVAAINSAGQFVSAAGATLTFGAGAPSSTCGTSPNGSGSIYLRTDGAASTTLYICSGTTWTAVTIP